jgi:hypothetical protein
MRILTLVFISLFAMACFASDTLIGFSHKSITPKEAVPLGGYGLAERRIIPWDFFNKHKHATFFKPNQGELDPIRVKSMVIRQNKKTLIFLSFDTVGMEGRLRKAIEKKLQKKGLIDFEIISTATHTHHGPGGLSKGFFWQVLAMDRYLPWFFERIVNDAVVSIMRSIANMQKGVLKHVAYDMPGFTRNRAPYHKKVDPTVNTIVGVSHSGEVLGGIVSLAMHPVITPIKILKFSADITGAIERELEKRFPSSTFLYFNGSVGDVSPNFGFAQRDEKSVEFANTYVKKLAQAKVIDSNWEIYKHSIRFTSKGHLNLGTCLKRKKLARWAKLSLRKAVPRNYNVQVLKLGHLIMFLWPGEPTTILGLEMKAKVKAPYHAFNIGLASDHYGYFVAKREWLTNSGEACSNMTGPYGGRDIMEGFSEILEKKIYAKK